MKRITPSADVSCGPVKTSPEGMLRLPSELTHVRPSTFSRRSVPGASMWISRRRREPLDQPRLERAQLAPRGDRVVAVQEQRALDEVLELARAHPGLLGGGRGRPQRDRPAPLSRTSRSGACARAARAIRAGSTQASAFALSVGLDPQRRVECSRLGQLGRRERRRVARRGPRARSPRTARAARRPAAATPRARAPRAAAPAAAARPASWRRPRPAGPGCTSRQ